MCNFDDCCDAAVAGAVVRLALALGNLLGLRMRLKHIPEPPVPSSQGLLERFDDDHPAVPPGDSWAWGIKAFDSSAASIPHAAHVSLCFRAWVSARQPSD